MPRKPKGTVEVLPLDPWEKQPREGDKAYAAFLIYRDQPANGVLRRSLAKVGGTTGLHRTTVENYSRKYGWRDRVSAWDRHQQAVQQAATEQRLRELGALQGNQLAAAAQAAMAPVVALLGQLQQHRARGVDPYKDRDLADLELAAMRGARVLPRLIGAERLVAGLSTENVAVSGDVRVEQARREAEAMPRADQERMLLGEGIVDGREATRENARRRAAGRQA